MKEPIKGIENCIEFLTEQNWEISIINDRMEEFLSGGFNLIVFDAEGHIYFSKFNTNNNKVLFTVDGYKIWAHSLEEAKSHLERIKKF